jgi:voltage-gated potassium channel
MTAPRRDPDEAAFSALAQIARGLFATSGAQGGALGYGTWKQGFREIVQRDPLDTLIVSVLGGAYLFWLAEKDKNPRCRTFWDAAVFVSTCLSVGYDNKFAVTESGKALATFLMTFGPSVAANAFAPPAAPRQNVAEVAPNAVDAPTAAATAESIELQRAILARLEAILAELQVRPPEAPRARG